MAEEVENMTEEVFVLLNNQNKQFYEYVANINGLREKFHVWIIWNIS